MNDDALSWQEQLASGFKNIDELLAYVGLSSEKVPVSFEAHRDFKTHVPRSFANKIIRNNPEDPLLKQVLPILDEMNEVSGYIKDPLFEKTANPIPGLLHKYSSRVLLTATSGCAINCRYCFRRHFDYTHNRLGYDEFETMLDYIRAHQEITEVILSGGDPLLLQDNKLAEMIEKIAKIASVKILRIHTRMPIVLPARVTPEFISLLQKTRLQTVCVVHCNHPNELDAEVKERMLALRKAGTHVLNQSVLLKGVNDDVEILCKLSYCLLESGIMPYYLHVLDKVKGTAHFDIPEENALKIYRAMRENLPGYLLPRLVREIPGELSKTLVGEKT